MVEVDGEVGVPIARLDAFEGVAIIARCIVDERVDRPRPFLDRSEGPAQRGDVDDIAMMEAHRLSVELGDESACGLLVEVEEIDAGALCREGFDHGSADAARASRDDNALTGE